MDTLEILLGDLRIILMQGIQASAEKTQLSIEQYIAQQQAMGVSDEAILANLNDDLTNDRFGFFKEFRGQVRDTIIGGIHQASSLGQFVENAKNGLNKEFKWILDPTIEFKNHCEDCKMRYGQIETLQTWQLIGLPASGFSRCNQRCRCYLEPV